MTSSRALLIVAGLLLITWCDDITAAGSGRAFPIDSENYVIKEFQSINPNLEWDHTNYLVDLAGRYANCKYIGVRGPVQVKEETPRGASIAGYTDYTDGRGSDVDAVNSYIRQVVNKWMKSGEVHSQVRLAQSFGCSVRPGCDGQVAISCMFSNPESSNIELPIPNPPGGYQALAFTPEQYYIAEEITGNRWDRSHFLENLSGFETDCAMIGARDWPFTKTAELSPGTRGLGIFGYAPNRGSTPNALVQILKSFKQIKYAKGIGCSLIPDCMIDGEMYVVASCLYVE
jgi:hypothetical protein